MSVLGAKPNIATSSKKLDPYHHVMVDSHPSRYGSSFLLLVAILGFAPNTDIESWAKAEAMARLRSKDSVEFGTHRFNIVQENRDTTWDKFAVRSIRMTEDDDDDDEEEEEEGEDGDEEEEEEDDE
jgi:hypothetical protein